LKIRNVLHRILAGILALFNIIPSITVIFNPLFFIMFFPFGAYFILTYPWTILKDIPDPFHPGESLYWLTYIFRVEDNIFLPSLFGWGILDVSLLVAGLMIFNAAFITWLKNLKRGLITHGIYRVVRHPQYLGMIILALGISIRSLRPASFIAWLTLLFGYLILASLEERTLLKTYSEEYGRYCEKVPFIIPFLRLKVPRWLSPESPYRYLLFIMLCLVSIMFLLISARNMVIALRAVFS
jgi:protein-S-isoprenylcysteine O-methyltransferase Ste14